MRKNILETYRLLIELKNEKSVPDRHEKDLDRCIKYLEEIIENDDEDKFKKNKNIIGIIAAIFKAFFDPP